MGISVVGTGHTKFGDLDKDLYDLLTEAGGKALDNSGVDPNDIDGIWVANFSGGSFNNQEHLAPIAMDIDPDLRFTPATRVENACASGSAAIDSAKKAIESGKTDYALVIGVEKMNSLDTKGVTKALAKASYWPEEGSKGMTFPDLFAEFAQGYLERYDLTKDQIKKSLAKAAAKNYRNALENPLAHKGIDWTYEDIIELPDKKNPIISDPLKLHDCSLVTDGAAAIVITSTDKAKKDHEDPVEITGLGHTTDYLPMDKRSKSDFVAGRKAVQKAYDQAGITEKDLDFAEVHDCFTIAEILAYEALGLAKNGEGWKLVDKGTVMPDGETPVNLSGGLKAKGHPVGATGVSMAVLATRQIQGNSIGKQAEGASTGITFNIGGSAATNYALIFQSIE